MKTSEKIIVNNIEGRQTLLAFFKSLSDDQKKLFVNKCGITMTSLLTYCYSTKKRPSVGLVMAIDDVSGGKVPKELLRPDFKHWGG